MVDKTIVNTGPHTTAQTWQDGEWTILYVEDGSGSKTTISLRADQAFQLAWGLTPELGRYFDERRAANAAVYELSYPDVRAQDLRRAAAEVDCDSGDCEHARSSGCYLDERGEFCGSMAADSLRKLADALDLKAKIAAERQAEDAKADPVF